MTHRERLIFLIQALLAEREEYTGIAIPSDYGEQKQLLRALMNVRPPQPSPRRFYRYRTNICKRRSPVRESRNWNPCMRFKKAFTCGKAILQRCG